MSNLPVSVVVVEPGLVSESQDVVVGHVDDAGPSVYSTVKSNSKMPLDGAVSVIGPICLFCEYTVLSAETSITPLTAVSPPA